MTVHTLNEDPRRDTVVAMSLPGHDQDCALAMLSQARLKSPLDDVQVEHLIAIGYRAASAQYHPATWFCDETWQHISCGVTQGQDPDWPKSGRLYCEACGSDSPLDEWRRLYVRDEAGS